MIQVPGGGVEVKCSARAKSPNTSAIEKQIIYEALSYNSCHWEASYKAGYVYMVPFDANIGPARQ